MNTVYGVVTDELGHAFSGGQQWATRSADVANAQPDQVIIDLEHDHRPAGEIVYFERDRNGRLWAVGHLDAGILPAVNVRVGDDIVTVPHDLYWSPSRIGGPDSGGFLFNSLSVTTSPARVCPKPLKLLPGDLNYRRQLPPGWQVNVDERGLLERAAVFNFSRQKGDPIMVVDLQERHRLAQYTDRTIDAGVMRQTLEDEHFGRPNGKIRRSAPYSSIIRVS